MATNLQVNASTQQAVGAFNALAASIANTTNQFNSLNATMARGTGNATRYAGSVTAINSAFNNLLSIASSVFNTIRTLGAGVMFVFSSIIKELDKLQGFNAIMSVSTKSTDDVAASYNFLRRTADQLGVQFDSLTSNYAKLVAALPPGVRGLQTAEKVFMGTAMAARTLHATGQDTQLMFYALTQIASKGVVSMEELRRQLGEKLPGVMQIAAKALNTLPESLEAAVRKGIVSSEKFLPIFGDALIRTFAESSEKASISVSAAIARLSNVWVDFVKNVLDSGAGNAIVGVFDALREKLSDPYLIERFAILIKDVSTRVTEFIQKITADDLRNGFDTATKAIELMVEVIGKLIEGLNWIINNSAKAGAIMGALAGAAVGSLAGPVGAVTGLAVGAAGGAYAGSQLAPSASQNAARAASNVAAEEARSAQNRERELLKFTQLIPLLQQFKGLNVNDIGSLFKAENLNTKTIQDLNRILTSKDFRNDKERAQGVRDYAKYGTVLGPQTNTLQDVLGGSNAGRKTAEQRALEGSEMRALGLNPNVKKELANYLTLLQGGKLNMDQYSEAVQNLIAKQPYMIAYQRELRELQGDENKAISEHISFIIRQVEAKDELASRMDEDLRLAGMRGESLQIEAQVLSEVNRLKGVGYDMTQQEVEALREKFSIINEIRQISGIEAQILSATLDKYKPQIDTLKALKNLQTNEPGFGRDQAQDYLVQQNPSLFQGTQEAMESQLRATQEMYSFIDGLRRADYISEATAVQMKSRVNQQYEAERLNNVSTFFGNLASLQKTGSRRLFEIGKAAAIAQALVEGIGAVQKAYNSAPYPYNFLAAAATSAAVYANVQQIRSTQAQFMDGGYTGNGPRGSVAGVTHGQEFVVNSQATARNRAALEAMNAGRSVQGSTGPIQVEIHQHGRPHEYTVEQISENRIRIIAREEASSVAPRAVATAIQDANSPVSKAIKQYTTAERNR